MRLLPTSGGKVRLRKKSAGSCIARRSFRRRRRSSDWCSASNHNCCSTAAAPCPPGRKPPAIGFGSAASPRASRTRSGLAEPTHEFCSRVLPVPVLVRLDKYTDLCRLVSVVVSHVPRGVPHAPILEARPHWWRGHGARRLYRCRDSPGDAAPPCGLSAAAADPAESPAGGDSDLDRAAPAASSDANRITGAAGARV